GAEGEAAGGGQASSRAAVADDAEGAASWAVEDAESGTSGLAQELGGRWQERFARIDAGAEEPRERLTDLVERGEHPLSWPRKLAGADAWTDAAAHEQEIHAGADG